MLEKLPIARWGWKDLNLFGWPLVAVILLCFVLGFALGHAWSWLAIIPTVLLLWLISFFRDPPRRIPDDELAIVAPADGTVVDITPLSEYHFIGRRSVRVGIFLSIFNVHINRAPTSGRVLEMHYQPGEFLDARRPECADRNEYMWIGMERTGAEPDRFAVRQISGMLAKRIVCELHPGQTVTRGEKFGMIKLGSRTELVLPADEVDITAQVGDKIRAGADVVARWK